jgi:hypothetical protein
MGRCPEPRAPPGPSGPVGPRFSAEVPQGRLPLPPPRGPDDPSGPRGPVGPTLGIPGGSPWFTAQDSPGNGKGVPPAVFAGGGAVAAPAAGPDAATTHVIPATAVTALRADLIVTDDCAPTALGGLNLSRVLAPSRGHVPGATPHEVGERAASQPMTNVDRNSNIERVPVRECPHCGVRQYAQVSYVADLECVVCGGLLYPAHAAAWKSWPVQRSQPDSGESSESGSPAQAKPAQARLARPDYGH